MTNQSTKLSLRQLVVCCVLSVLSSLLWFLGAVLLAVALCGPENGSGATANAILSLSLPGCLLWLVVLYFTTTYFEGKNYAKRHPS